jgi:hypothetical protein
MAWIASIGTLTRRYGYKLTGEYHAKGMGQTTAGGVHKLATPFGYPTKGM